MKKYDYSDMQKIGYRPFIKLMVDELNEAKITPMDYHMFLFNENDPDSSFLGEIACNFNAIEYLKEIGLLNNGICPLCGKRPIEKNFTFTSGLNTSIKFEICKNCYKQGNQTSLNPSNKEGCYIATYCYGDYNSKEVIQFRHFRDTFLARHKIGRLLIRIYYFSSPIIIRLIGNNTSIQKFLKNNFLDGLFRFLESKSKVK